jgi:hypothetical protein
MRINRPLITGITFAVAVALASPAWAQAKSRTTGSSGSSGSTGSSGSAKTSGGSSSSGSASSSSGSSRGGDAGSGASSSSSSGSGSRGGSLVMLPDQRATSREPQKTPPQKTTQTAAPRGRSGSGDDTAASRQPARTPRGGTNDERPGIVVTERRTRDGRPIVGSAGERPRSTPGGGVIIIDGNVWSPFFSPGFGWNAGFVGYDPWRFSHGWYFGRYGPWGYDPFWSPWGYDPYYDPYWDSRYGRGYGQVPSQPERLEPTTGSIRLRVSPESALVIIDGTQVGVVDDFNGLSDHLELTAGTHQLELRAQGYEPLTKTVTVRAGKTLTERLSMKKIQ